ncbi:MAG: hypothetical protein P1P82_00055 [Bacteroidales bacterium]|nr:hypothetical protein [Bacteroidales bacterium]MDT8429946.1 hypothetical protein [Bacteroidales bacterium]
MKNSEKHLQDLNEIRQIMERSTKFLSLSGWAGILAGIIAIVGTVAAILYLDSRAISYEALLTMHHEDAANAPLVFFIADATIVLVLALSGAVFFSCRKAKKSGEKIWSPVTKRLLYHLALPLVTGGILVLILVWQRNVHLVAPFTLIFYGLSLVNAGKYTNREIVWLGIAEITTGLAATIWTQHGLWLWGTGFGIYHIIYGITLYHKYERKTVAHG